MVRSSQTVGWSARLSQEHGLAVIPQPFTVLPGGLCEENRLIFGTMDASLKALLANLHAGECCFMGREEAELISFANFRRMLDTQRLVPLRSACA